MKALLLAVSAVFLLTFLAFIACCCFRGKFARAFNAIGGEDAVDAVLRGRRGSFVVDAAENEGENEGEKWHLFKKKMVSSARTKFKLMCGLYQILSQARAPVSVPSAC